MLTAKDKQIDVKVGDKVITYFGTPHDAEKDATIRYRRICGVVRVSETQCVLQEEGSSRQDRFYRSGHRAGRKINGTSYFYVASDEEILKLRVDKKRLSDEHKKREAEVSKERNKPENVLVRRICDTTDERWRKLPVEELQRIVKLLYGEE